MVIKIQNCMLFKDILALHCVITIYKSEKYSKITFTAYY